MSLHHLKPNKQTSKARTKQPPTNYGVKAHAREDRKDTKWQPRRPRRERRCELLRCTWKGCVFSWLTFPTNTAPLLAARTWAKTSPLSTNLAMLSRLVLDHAGVGNFTTQPPSSILLGVYLWGKIQEKSQRWGHRQPTTVAVKSTTGRAGTQRRLQNKGYEFVQTA